MHKISFITTCKGRLHHVRQTLPLLVNVPQAEVIFVDYGCPDQSGAWVQKNHPSVQVVFVNDDPGFCLPRARNAGAQKASNPWLFFVDADIVVKPALAAWLLGDLSASKIYKSSSVNGVRDPQTWGSFLCHHNVFKQVGGYDEVFRGWGGEDEDIYRRIQGWGVSSAEYPGEAVASIPHDDHERTKFQVNKDIVLNHIVNELYMTGKEVFTAQVVKIREMPQPVRTDIMNQVKAGVSRWDAAGRPDNFPVVLSCSSGRWLPRPYRLGVEVTLKLIIQRK